MVALLYCLITDDVKNEWNRVLERRRSTNALGSYNVSSCFKLRQVFRLVACIFLFLISSSFGPQSKNENLWELSRTTRGQWTHYFGRSWGKCIFKPLEFAVAIDQYSSWTYWHLFRFQQHPKQTRFINSQGNSRKYWIEFLEFLEKVLESSIFFGDSILILTKFGTVSKHERNSDIFTLVYLFSR